MVISTSIKTAMDAEDALFREYGIARSDHHVHLHKYGITLRVTQVGAGPPVVVLPGNVGEAYPFVPLLPELGGRTVYLINRPGGGMSGGIDFRQVDYKQFAIYSISCVMDALCISKADIIGHSLGGHWVLWFAQEKPNRVISLVLIGVSGGLPGTKVPAIMGVLRFPGVEKLIRRLMRSRGGTDSLKIPESISGPCTSNAMAQCRKAFMALPEYLPSFFSMIRAEPAYRKQVLCTDEIAGIKVPVMLIWGTDDPFGKPDAGRRISETMPNCVFCEIESGSHLPWLDQPKQCGELILGFIIAENMQTHGN